MESKTFKLTIKVKREKLTPERQKLRRILLNNLKLALKNYQRFHRKGLATGKRR